MAKTFNDIIDGLYIQIGLVEKEVCEGNTSPQTALILQQIQDKIAELENREVNIEGLDELKEKINSLQNLDFTQYVTKTELPDLLPPTGHLLTESEADELYARKTDIPQPQDLSEYALKSELPDTSNLMTEYQADAKYVLNSKMVSYARKTDIPQPQDLSEYALKSELPDTSNLMTEYQADAKYVLNSEMVSYARKTDIPQPQDLSEYALKSELPDTSNLMTEYQADAKYVLNSEMVSYARKTDIPQPQDLSEYALKSEIVEPDLTPYVKKSELTQPDLEPYETKEHAEQTYANKSELPDLSIYALKSEIGTGANLTAEEISKTISMELASSYTSPNYTYINATSKDINVSFEGYDYSINHKYEPVPKTITIKPNESFRMYEGEYNPIIVTPTPENNYKESVTITYADGSQINRYSYPIRKYLNPSALPLALDSALDYNSNKYNFLTKEKLSGDKDIYSDFFFVDTKPEGVIPYFQGDESVIQDSSNKYKNKYWMNGSTIKILYDNAISTNGDLTDKLTIKYTVATNRNRSVFYKGLLKGVYDAETGDSVINGFNNKSVIAVFEITDPRYGLK